jgi:endoglucanase
MRRGKTYLISTGSLASNGTEWKLMFDESKVRSEAIHVNLLGYVPSVPQKFGYVYHWLGDKGGLDLKAYEGAATGACRCWWASKRHPGCSRPWLAKS